MFSRKEGRGINKPVQDGGELQENSPKYQQEYAENDFQIEKKTFSPNFATLHHTKILQ